MKQLAFFTLGLVLFFSCTTPEETKENAFKPAQKWLDNNGVYINAHGGGVMYHNDKYYWYGQHMVEGKIGNSAQVGVHVYASDDLYNWEDKGIALSVDSLNPESEIAKGCLIERPKVIYNEKTQKFVMWFHLELKGQGYKAARAAVAVADKPTGPFEYVESFRSNKGVWPLNAQVFDTLNDAGEVNTASNLPVDTAHAENLVRDIETGQMVRDMTLFVDDDKKAYHLFASEENSTLHIAELSDDYLSYSGKYVRLFSKRYMEAPTILKTSEGKYYFIGSDCTGWDPNPARSAVAEHIFGPWKELGNPCVGPDSSTTFRSQGAYILPVQGKKDAFIFMADRWTPKNPIDGGYIWLPLYFEEGKIRMEWKDKWNLSYFD